MPQYEGLALKDISMYLSQHYPELFDYMPDPQEIHKVGKEWICNVCASVIGQPFNHWVKQQIEARN